MYSYEQVHSAMKEVVVEKPEDYTYELPTPGPGNCVYSYGGEPSCLMGHVVYRMAGAEALMEVTLDAKPVKVNKWFQDNFDERALAAANLAQLYQDEGCTWGFALRSFQDAEEGYW